MRAQEALARSHAELEQRVRERTSELEISREKLQAFNYAVSHDLRAPVRHISGFAEMTLQDETSLSTTAKNHLNRIIAAAQRMDGIIQGLLRLAQTSHGQITLAPVDLGRLIVSVAGECAPPGWNGHLQIEPATLPVVPGDEALLRQLFFNLINNAFKFSAKTPRPMIEIYGSDGTDNEIIVTVHDNGAGFDMKYADKLFTPLQRLHRADEFEGSGIGLASVRNIVDMHGGRVWADAHPGLGATFSVALKRSTPAPAV